MPKPESEMDSETQAFLEAEKAAEEQRKVAE
jgi:hypothetical protein